VSSLLKNAKQSDDALMVRAQAGDTGAFELLYDRHAERALQFARAICRDAECADEAVQEGFLAIWHSRSSYRPGRDGFQTWAMKIVRSTARREQGALLASLRQLPEDQAEVIVLAFYGELSHSEIATQLDLPAGTVKGRMRLGLEKLRLEMDKTSDS
jgi:RNA polymerase sigma-70 factor (ECF subfamily)